MCVIVYKPKNIAMPSMLDCFDANPDGAGYAFIHEQLEYRKGFMTYRDFMSSIDFDTKRYDMVFHFRMSSAVGVKPELTHPFLILKDSDNPLCYAGCDNILFHNGHLSTMVTKEMTDTQNIAIALSSYKSKLYSESMKTILSALNQKIVIMNNSRISFIGDYILYNQCYYSNMFWQYYLDVCPTCQGDMYDYEDDIYICSECLSYFQKTGKDYIELDINCIVCQNELTYSGPNSWICDQCLGTYINTDIRKEVIPF